MKRDYAKDGENAGIIFTGIIIFTGGICLVIVMICFAVKAIEWIL